MEQELDINLDKVILPLKRWWWALLVAAALAATAAYFYSLQLPRLYQATTTIMVGQSIKATELTTRDIELSGLLAQTYSDMAGRQLVLEGVVKALSLELPWSSLKDRVTADPIRGTQLFQIKVTADDPEQARLIADEVARQLILHSPTNQYQQQNQQNQLFVQQRLEDLQVKIQTGQARLEALQADMSGPLTAEQVKELQQEIDTLEDLLADWEKNYTELLILYRNTDSPNQLAIIESAQAGLKPVSPNLPLNTAVAGGVGLAVAVALALGIGAFDRTIRSAGDLSTVAEARVLGAVGRLRGRRPEEKLTTSAKQADAHAEAYQVVAARLRLASTDRPFKSFVVTSAKPHEGKSLTVANLGLALAQTGLRTIIIDADLRQPVQHGFFQVPNTGGLADLFQTQSLDPRAYLKRTAHKNLQLITSGLLPVTPPQILGSTWMKDFVTQLEQMADMVIFDSPPLLHLADTAILSSQVGQAVVVVKVGQTKLNEFEQALSTLQAAKVSVVGSVLNGEGQSKAELAQYTPYYTGYQEQVVSPNKRARASKKFSALLE